MELSTSNFELSTRSQKAPAQLSFETIPKDQANSELVQSKAWQEMVEVGGRICQVLGYLDPPARFLGSCTFPQNR